MKSHGAVDVLIMSKTCSLENALKAQERFDVVIDTVSSGFS